jgi:hypothetical protein
VIDARHHAVARVEDLDHALAELARDASVPRSLIELEKEHPQLGKKWREAHRAVSMAINTALTSLEEQRAAATDPRIVQQIEAELVRLKVERHLTYAQLFMNIGDEKGYERELGEAARVLLRTGGLLHDDGSIAVREQRFLNKNGEERGWLASLLPGDTAVGFIDDAQAKTAAQRWSAIPRQTLMQLIARMGEATETNVLAQVLEQMSSRTNDPTTKLEYELVRASHRTELAKGDPQALKKVVADLEELLFDGPPDVQRRAGLAIAGILASMSPNGEDGKWAYSRLHKLRAELEQQDSLDRDSLARLTLMEATAAMYSNQAQHAQAAIQHLSSKYGDVEFVREATRTFYQENYRNTHTEAFLKVMWRELNSETMAESLATGVGASAVCGAIGFCLGGPIGLGLGLIVGGAIGTAGLKARNFARGLDNMGEAFETGMTHLSWMDFAEDSVALGLDVVSVAAPVRGATALGMAGMEAMFKGARSELTAAITQQLERKLGRSVPAIGDEALVRAARGVLFREWARETFTFGGKKALALAIAAAGTPIARGLLAIETSELGAAEKEHAQQQLIEQVVSSIATLACAFAGSTVINKTAFHSAKLRADLEAALGKLDVKSLLLRARVESMYTVKRGAFGNEPALTFNPDVRLDHNYAFHEAPPSLPKPKRNRIAPAQLQIRDPQGHAASPATLERVAVWRGHGSRAGFSGVSSEAAAEAIADRVVRFNNSVPDHRKITHVLLDACAQGDRRIELSARSHAQVMQQLVDDALARRKIGDPLIVLASDRGGPLYSGGLRAADAHDVLPPNPRLGKHTTLFGKEQKIPLAGATFVPAREQHPKLQVDAAEVASVALGAAAAILLGAAIELTFTHHQKRAAAEGSP